MTLSRRLYYLWFFLIMKITSILPDLKPIMWLRGFLVRPCFHSCGKNFQIASGVSINYTNNLIIGNNVYFAYGCWINAIGSIQIGDEVMLGPYVILSSGNHTRRNDSYRFGTMQLGQIKIDQGTWIGASAKVLCGVTIGKGVCCAAGSVVTKSIPDNVLAGGIPAKVIKKLS